MYYFLSSATFKFFVYTYICMHINIYIYTSEQPSIKDIASRKKYVNNNLSLLFQFFLNSLILVAWNSSRDTSVFEYIRRIWKWNKNKDFIQ